MTNYRMNFMISSMVHALLRSTSYRTLVATATGEYVWRTTYRLREETP